MFTLNSIYVINKMLNQIFLEIFIFEIRKCHQMLESPQHNRLQKMTQK